MEDRGVLRLSPYSDEGFRVSGGQFMSRNFNKTVKKEEGRWGEVPKECLFKEKCPPQGMQMAESVERVRRELEDTGVLQKSSKVRFV